MSSVKMGLALCFSQSQLEIKKGIVSTECSCGFGEGVVLEGDYGKNSLKSEHTLRLKMYSST